MLLCFLRLPEEHCSLLLVLLLPWLSTGVFFLPVLASQEDIVRSIWSSVIAAHHMERIEKPNMLLENCPEELGH